MATAKQVKSFISQIAPLIQKYAKQYGYKVASPVIAQACCESAFGTSSLGYKYHNYFGLKCGSSWKGASVNLKTKEEYTVGTLTNIKANFRVYDSMEAGVQGYFEFIQCSRYANLKTATTPQQYLEVIKADGYATSSTYVNTNMTVVNKYGLTVYDNFSGAAVQPETPSAPQAQTSTPYQTGKTYTLQSNLWVRASAGGHAQPWDKLTPAGRSACIKATGGAIMIAGTAVTCKRVYSITTGAVWMQIPSGWLCARDEKGKVFIK